MRVKLTDYTVQGLRLPEGRAQCDFWDTTLPRFGLRIGKRAKTFMLNVGKRRVSLGRYPFTSLKEARDKAKRRLALKYLPPASVRSQDASEWYLEAIKSEKRDATLHVYSTYLKRLPDLPLHQLTVQNLTKALPSAKSAANLCFATFKAFLSWCVEQGHLDVNPLLHRRLPNRKNTRDRLLTDDEIKRIWNASYAYNSFGDITRLLILTGQRLNQIASLEREWIAHSVIQFPASIMKNRMEHHIPVTDTMRLHLAAVPFSSRAVHTTLTIFRDALELPHFTLHDFRRYFSSTASKLKIPIDITEVILAHTSGSRSPIQRIYDRDTRLPQMREALDAYHAHLAAIGCKLTEPARTNSTST
jgi:integrase